MEPPLVCSYINGPCPHYGTPACADQATITCRNIRQKNERKKTADAVAGPGPAIGDDGLRDAKVG